MIWLVWRRQRAAFLLAAALLAGTAIVLVIARLLLVGAAADLGAAGCVTDPGAACPNGARGELYETFRDFHGPIRAWLWALFPTVGLIVGVGLFTREFEQRTHVLALTQATSRARWWATGVLTSLLPAAIGVLLVAIVATWALRPFGVLYEQSRMVPLDFDVHGLVPVANTLLAAALAISAGLLIRSSLATVVVTVLGWTLVWYVIGFTRYDILPDQIAIFPFVDSYSWAEVDIGGMPTDFGHLDAAGNVVHSDEVVMICDQLSFDSCLQDAGAVRTFVAYQPESSFWPLQVIVAGISAALSILLLGGGLLRLRRDL